MVLQGDVDERLQYIARRHEFSVLRAPSAERAIADILRVRPEVVIVHVANLMDEALNLIRFIANAGRTIALIAVAAKHCTDTEKAVRRAGAMWYLPEVEADRIGEILTTIRPGGR